MKRRYLFLLVTGMFLLLSLSGTTEAKQEKIPKIGPVKLNAHPSSLEGKTVLLRWNGKFNGDKYLSYLGECLTKQVKNVRLIKLWEIEKSSASISKDLQASEQVAAAVAKLKPDLVIAAQAD